MAAPMFDGQFRSRPQVSLRGASIQVERQNLLERAHRDREGRETVRRRNQAAVHIQAGYRGHRVRQAVYAELRVMFDKRCSTCSNVDDLKMLSRLFLVFYKEDKDEERLVELCKKWVQCRTQLLLLLPDSAPWWLHLSHLLVYCMHALCSPHLNPSLLLRVIEVFLDPSSYATPAGQAMVRKLNSYVACRGFFRCLLNFLKMKIPSPSDESEMLLTPMADSLLSYLTRPLEGAEGVVYEKLANEVLSQARSPHVKFMVLPRLVNINVKFDMILQSILLGVSKKEVEPNDELLYSVIQLGSSHLQSSVAEEGVLVKYMRLLSVLLEKCPGSEGSTVTEENEDEDEEEEEEWEGHGRRGEGGVFQHCLDLIGGRHTANVLHVRDSLSMPVLETLCSLCYQLIRLHRTSALRKLHLLQILAFSPSPLLASLWRHLTSLSIQRMFGSPVLCVDQLSRGLPLPPPQAVQVLEQLSTFCVLFSLKLFTLHDAEFYRDKEIPSCGHMPFSLVELPAMVSLLRDLFLCLQMEKHLPQSHSRTTQTSRPHRQEWQRLKVLVLDLLSALYRRDCRRAFCKAEDWVAPALRQSILVPPEEFSARQSEEERELLRSTLSPAILKQAELLQEAPFLFPFLERVRFFNSLVMNDRLHVQGAHQAFLLGGSLKITVNRDRVYEDAFASLGGDIDIRDKVRVQYINAQGLVEPGVDGGGVFREFLNDALKTGFDPNRGYFATTSDGQLYPNAQSYWISDNTDQHYRFLGKLLGKALYEDQLVDLPFASFFLAKLAVGGRGFVGIQHLASLDHQLYRNLLSLKYHEGNIEDLALNFTITVDHMGQTRVYELKKEGVEQVVSRSNYQEYINLVAHYKLNVQLHRQYQMFREGLEQVIPAQWLRLFSQSELQVLISGAEVPIDVNDLQQNTLYKSEYNSDHECIVLFWEVVSDFTEVQKQLLLKFVTSCSRPPLLGFKELHPPFTISPLDRDNLLPTASTCSNLLLLPKFKDKETMRSKVLYAIQSNAGFELC